jgi:hypothetical protein
MPPTHIQYGGRYELPLPPPEQLTFDNIITLDQLQRFDYPPIHLDPFELWSFIERQWKLRKALLEGVQRKLTQAQSAEDVHPEFLPVPAGILYWMASFEEWLSMSFLRGVMEEPGKSQHSFQEAGDYERAFMIGSFDQLYDRIFKTLCDFHGSLYNHQQG